MPLCHPGNIMIQASITGMRRTGFGIYHRIPDGAGALTAEGLDVIVLFNYRNG